MVVGQLAILLAASSGSLLAQRAADSGDPDEVHVIHVSPHVIVFDDHTRQATVTLSNAGAVPLEGDVVLQYGFTEWRNQDTVLFHPAGKAPDWIEDAYDTVIANPDPQDRYAGRWLTGVPTHVQLAPHEHRKVDLHIVPPLRLPAGEYYVRLVTLSHPSRQKGGKSLDTKTRNVLPVLGNGPPPPRDSARIYYRHGPQTMHVTIAVAKAAIDTTRSAEDYAEAHELGSNPLRTLIKIHLTGTAHFEGYWESYYLVPTGQHINLTWEGSHTNEVISLQHDMVMRWLSQASMLTPGHYLHVLRLVPDMDDFPPDKRLPMDTVQVSIPFDVR